MTTDDLIDEAVDRIMTGRDNEGALTEAAYKRDRLYFRKAIAPVIAQLRDENADLYRQRNDARARLAEYEAAILNSKGTK